MLLFLVAVPCPAHTVQEATIVNGYTIPPGAVVLADIYGLHHNKEYWGDPDTFRIDRWIDENGELKHHEAYFMPFSVG